MSRKNKKNDEENGAPEDGHNDLMTVRIGASAGENKARGILLREARGLGKDFSSL